MVPFNGSDASRASGSRSAKEIDPIVQAFGFQWRAS
jgi:hypothetical protein